jgi:hypothetical protein
MARKKRKEEWKGMPAIIGKIYVIIGDLVISCVTSGFIKPKVKTLFRKEVTVLGREVTLVLTSYIGEARFEMLDEKGRTIYACQHHGEGRVGSDVLGFKKDYIPWEMKTGNFLRFILQLSDKENLEGVSESRFLEVIPPQIGKKCIGKYVSFFRKYFGQGRVARKTKEVCHQAH